mmetsp:Transcript_21880/g.42506  ORF Transcript_21880/g.42506 Transcript_21880/m.42506 type:complete len:222 (+) Transcript_21880:187-852(+)
MHAASWAGVIPAQSTTLRLAPASSSALTAPACPPPAALCSGVQRMSSDTSRRAPVLTRAAIVGTLPTEAAWRRGVAPAHPCCAHEKFGSAPRASSTRTLEESPMRALSRSSRESSDSGAPCFVITPCSLGAVTTMNSAIASSLDTSLDGLLVCFPLTAMAAMLLIESHIPSSPASLPWKPAGSTGAGGGTTDGLFPFARGASSPPSPTPGGNTVVVQSLSI